MGNLLAKLKKNDELVEPKRILMLGLDNAGKTTILYTISLGETVNKTVPTVGFNLQTVTHKDISMSVWDVGGQSKLRGLWHHYLKGAHAVIYVIDSSDAERLKESSEEFHSLLEAETLQKAAVLVMANKRDVDGCLSLVEIKKGLKWDSIKQSRAMVETIATRNEGLTAALDWVTNELAGSDRTGSIGSNSKTTRKASIIPKNSIVSGRSPVLTDTEADRENEFKAAPPVHAYRLSASERSMSTTPPIKYGAGEMSGLSLPANGQGQITQALVLTLHEAAELLKTNHDEVVTLLLDGVIKGRKISGEWRISTRTVIDYLDREC